MPFIPGVSGAWGSGHISHVGANQSQTPQGITPWALLVAAHFLWEAGKGTDKLSVAYSPF